MDITTEFYCDPDFVVYGITLVAKGIHRVEILNDGNSICDARLLVEELNSRKSAYNQETEYTQAQQDRLVTLEAKIKKLQTQLRKIKKSSS